MATVEQQIMDAVIANFKAISKANGYSFDICDRVYEWLDEPAEVSEPMIDVRDHDNDHSNTDEDEHNYQIQVRLFDSGSASPASVREKQADILTAFGEIDNSGLVTGSWFMSSTKDIQPGSQKISMVVFEFEVYYPTTKWEI